MWVGGGLAGLNDGHGLPAELPVDETTLGRLFGHGHDPVTGQLLGRGLATRRLSDGAVCQESPDVCHPDPDRVMRVMWPVDELAADKMLALWDRAEARDLLAHGARRVGRTDAGASAAVAGAGIRDR